MHIGYVLLKFLIVLIYTYQAIGIQYGSSKFLPKLRTLFGACVGVVFQQELVLVIEELIVTQIVCFVEVTMKVVSMLLWNVLVLCKSLMRA